MTIRHSAISPIRNVIHCMRNEIYHRLDILDIKLVLTYFIFGNYHLITHTWVYLHYYIDEIITPIIQIFD